MSDWQLWRHKAAYKTSEPQNREFMETVGYKQLIACLSDEFSQM